MYVYYLMYGIDTIFGYDSVSTPSGHRRDVKYQTWVSPHKI